MELSLLGRRKIAVLFLFGVGIPSLALAYLAFRGIRNELALLEQRRLGEHIGLAGIVGATIAARIAMVEQAFIGAVADHDDPLAPDLADSLSVWRSQEPLVEEVFFLEEPATVHLPVARLLYHPDGSVPTPATSWPPGAAASMRTGQQREFQQRRFGAALASYESAFSQVADPVLKGEALVAMARSQRMAGQLEAAIASWERLLADYAGVRTTSGVSLGPMALLEHGSLLLATGDSSHALDTYLELYERLVGGEWTLERAEYEFFTGRAHDSATGLGAGNALAEIRAADQERRESTERLLLFQASAGGDLVARVFGEIPGDAAGPRRFVLESAGHTYLVSLPNRASSARGVWGLLLDADYLRDRLLRPVLERHIDLGTTDWVVRGRDGSTILTARDGPPAGPLSINATFTNSFPPWLIEFYQQPQSPYKRLFASSQSIYLYMFLAIASIMLFGLVLTVRAVGHELELARLKSKFVSTVSHEFRSPLTSIRQLAEMLQAGRVPSEDRRRHYYDVLVEQSSRLSTLVTNILDLARIEEGRKEFRFEAVDVGPLVDELVTMTRHRVGHEGYAVETHVTEPFPPVRADRNSIVQALANLVDNALQYSGDAKRVNLYASSGDGYVAITVEDQGVGIPRRDLDRVFDRFYRGGNELTRSVRGSGLGLTLVKEIVEAHGGSVHVESELGSGSKFSIRLPVMTEQINGEDPDR